MGGIGRDWTLSKKVGKFVRVVPCHPRVTVLYLVSLVSSWFVEILYITFTLVPGVWALDLPFKDEFFSLEFILRLSGLYYLFYWSYIIFHIQYNS